MFKPLFVSMFAHLCVPEELTRTAEPRVMRIIHHVLGFIRVYTNQTERKLLMYYTPPPPFSLSVRACVYLCGCV